MELHNIMSLEIYTYLRNLHHKNSNKYFYHTEISLCPCCPSLFSPPASVSKGTVT
jgi:hypothetical protein